MDSDYPLVTCIFKLFLGLPYKFGFYRIPISSRFGINRIHCIWIRIKLTSAYLHFQALNGLSFVFFDHGFHLFVNPIKVGYYNLICQVLLNE